MWVLLLNTFETYCLHLVLVAVSVQTLKVLKYIENCNIWTINAICRPTSLVIFGKEESKNPFLALNVTKIQFLRKLALNVSKIQFLRKLQQPKGFDSTFLWQANKNRFWLKGYNVLKII